MSRKGVSLLQDNHLASRWARFDWFSTRYIPAVFPVIAPYLASYLGLGPLPTTILTINHYSIITTTTYECWKVKLVT